MSNETSKALSRRKSVPLFHRAFSGHGIDIGCGKDILTKESFPQIISVDPFDLEHGDAQYIDEYVKKQYDFVHSSQCLEHMHDPFTALVRWLRILKSGGYLVATFPDEDLYEQGVFPSRWNSDHKHTFTIYKPSSWSPKSINVIDLLKFAAPDAEAIKIERIDTFYNYELKDVDQTRGAAEAFIEIVLKKR